MAPAAPHRILYFMPDCLPLCVHDSCCLKPTWQRAILGIRLEFRGAHAVEKIVETYLLTAINPLTSRIDLAIRLNCGNNRTCGYVGLTGTPRNSCCR
jgi:hypothetical protein